MYESEATMQEKIQSLEVEEMLREARALKYSETNISRGIRLLDRQCSALTPKGVP